MENLDQWVKSILADPVTKLSARPENFHIRNGVIDARIFLKNTYGYDGWADGQSEFEGGAVNYSDNINEFRHELEYDQPVYERFKMSGRILDVGGGGGTVRQFLPQAIEFVSIDPWLGAPLFYKQGNKKEIYSCLNQPLNFVGATAEFLPFIADSFDWIHMRSMLDHVQVVDLALLEARRVLKKGGCILIGMYVEGGRSGIITLERRVKDFLKFCLESLGVNRWKDHHIWHPSYMGLIKLIQDNGFYIEDTYWQPHWNDTVCYIKASKK